MYWHYPLMDEANDGTGGGAGGGTDELELDVSAAVDEIGAGLGLGADPSDKGEDEAGSATPSGEKTPASATKDAGAEARARAEAALKLDAAKKSLTEKKVDFTGKSDEDILKLATPTPKGAPKSYKKEIADAHWAKLDPGMQDYLLQREEEIARGFQENGQAVKYATAIRDAIQPYEPLLAAQGIQDHAAAMKFLLNAHYILSSAPEGDRHKYMGELIQSYKLDPAKIAEAMKLTGGAEAEPAWAKELREKNAQLEARFSGEQNARFAAIKAETSKEVEAFASDPKHIYFDEVAVDITRLLNADRSLTLAAAYDAAVYANPVTRAKELGRLEGEAKAKAAKEAEEKAAAAVKARGTRPRGSERERASPDLLGTIDDTLHETYKEIQSRT
jgi:hypothetical protein